ncbi:MAG: hypothetical protein HFG27_00485 [Provencibacterium sp.]|nr:hypothetical protein [Provencibacterium sp.]
MLPTVNGVLEKSLKEVFVPTFLSIVLPVAALLIVLALIRVIFCKSSKRPGLVYALITLLGLAACGFLIPKILNKVLAEDSPFYDRIEKAQTDFMESNSFSDPFDCESWYEEYGESFGLHPPDK